MNTPIQMVDLQGQYQRIKPEIDQAIQESINQAAFINGPQVKEFAKQLADYNRVKQVVPCGNGTDALQIAMMALDLKPGDEVILPVFTYVATAEVIALLGLKPVFVDVDPETFNIDIDEIESKITNKTAAIVPVHLFGQCADMENLLALARKHNLYVIEDAAQAIGAEYIFSDGSRKRAGTMSEIGTTSFFPSKNLGCFGDGGAMLIEDTDLAKKAQVIANHGQVVKYYHEVIGINSRLDTLQAAILIQKLKHLDDFAARRNNAADFYDQGFNNVPSLIRPKRSSNSTHVFHQYTVKILNGRRDEIKTQLASKGIPSMVYYPVPLHQQNAYKGYNQKSERFPVAEELSTQVLSLPMHTELNEEQLNYITTSLLSLL